MTSKSKLIAALVLTGAIIGGVTALSTGSSHAGLKDDSCWDPKQVTIKDFVHTRSCLAYGIVEPNNGERASAPSNVTKTSGGDPTPPTDPGDCVGADCGPPTDPGDCVGANCTPPGGCEATNSCEPTGCEATNSCEPTGCEATNSCEPTGCEATNSCEPKPRKQKNNRGYGNGEEGNCNGKACFDSPRGEAQNPGNGPKRP